MKTAALRQCQKIYLEKAKFVNKISGCFPSFPGLKKNPEGANV